MIVLLDLNYTLVANSLELKRSTLDCRKRDERYRTWLLDLIQAWGPEATVLLTVRRIEDEAWTLANIQRLCNWQPDLSMFNNVGKVTPPAWKEHALKTRLFPRFGSNGDRYLAVESNLDTHKMYGKYGIKGMKVFPATEK